MKKISIFIICFTLPFCINAVEIKPTGDFRTGYFSKVDTKKGKDSKEGRIRFRAGIKAKFNKEMSFKFRLAGRVFIDGDNDTGFDYLDSIPAYSDSIPAGQITIDNLFFKYQFSSKSYIRMGRFKSSYELMGVAKKSLDRNNGPNTDITWTDGLHLSAALWGSHQLNAIVQYNPENGTTVLRKPLSLASDKSRLSYFLGIRHRKAAGPFVQREVDLTFMPYALCKNGIVGTSCRSGEASAYVAGVARVAMQWPILKSGVDFLLGTEIGYSPTTPKESAVGGSSSKDASGLAYQITLNFMNFFPKHSVGLVHGRAGAGWLISPDFSSNFQLNEIRYAWKFAKQQKLELRFRQRDAIIGNDRTRKDFYFRYTVKF